jgi:hypothetical protein
VAPRTALSTLKNYCLEEITLLDPSTFFESESFLNADEIVVVALLERDDLGMSESELWYHVLRWGITNTPSLDCTLKDKNISDNNENVYKWVSEDFAALKETLKNCIPFIRFFHISQTEFYSKVKPYSKILPEGLIEEVTNYHLTGDSSSYNVQPPRTCRVQIDSKLANSKQVAIIGSWIDNNYESYSPKSNLYTFKLLFRASVDNPNLFHEKCDNAGPTIIIIKMRDNNRLVGGYNPLNISWKRSWFNWFNPARNTKESFIFSMDSSVKTILDKNAKLSQVVPEYKKYAIYDHPWDGPCFGTGPDLWVSINSNNPIGYIIEKCYPSIMNSGLFYWEDWEIFSVQRTM